VACGRRHRHGRWYLVDALHRNAAFSLPVPVLYDWPTVLLSLVAAVFAAAVALFVVSRKHMGWLPALVGSAIMGSGIATMHYTGMAAMRLSAMSSYDLRLVTLSVAVAIVISLAALWLSFRFREDKKASSGWWKAASAIVMGAAIPVMHYTGMAAASWEPSALQTDLSHAVTLSASGVATVTLLVLGLAILIAMVDRRFSARAIALTASGPKVIGGTTWPSMTSTCNDAICGATAATSCARRRSSPRGPRARSGSSRGAWCAA